MEEKKLTLKDVMKHSKLCRKIRVYDSFELVLRPWTTVQLQEGLPLIIKLTKEIKGLGLGEEVKKYTILELMNAFLPVIEKSKEFVNDIVDIIYLSLELSNETIVVEIDGTKQEMPLFSKEEMVNYLQLPVLIEILAVLFELNFSKNPSGEAKPANLVQLVTE
jgi:hypothetical protein